MVLSAGGWVLGRRAAITLAVAHLAISPSRPLAAQASAPPPQPPFGADSAAVLDVARTALHAMRINDTASMRRLLAGPVPMRIAGDRNGTPLVANDSADSWIHAVATTPAGMLEERIGTPAVQVDGNLAQVWTYYEFRRGEAFSHCGADQFVLARTAEGWKIVSLNYSIRREGCRQDLAFTPRDRALLDVVAAERAFAHHADTANTPAAFLWALREDAITLDSDGVKLMRPMYQGRRNNGSLLSWGPSWVDASADGVMGLTMGPWTWRPARDSAVQDRGHFLTVWLKEQGRWQVALDLGVGGDSTSRLDEPLIVGPPGVVETASLGVVTAADRRISGGDWVARLRAVTAPDARILREGIPMAIGPSGISGARSVRFRPLGGRISNSGDIAATHGTYTDGAKKGAYVRFWRKTPEGWRVTVDRMAE